MEDDPKPTPSDPSQSSFHKLWAELKRRHVVRVAMVYAIVGWLVIQVANATFSDFGIPIWAYRFVVLMVVLGFPISVVVAWAFELTPEGIKTSKTARKEQGDLPTSNKLQSKGNWTAIGFAAGLPTLIFGALAVFFFLQRAPETTVAETNPDSAEAPLEELISIAVLPLINMSSDEENRYFADGVHEDILTRLTSLKGFKVISRTTMLRYGASDKTLREIGKDLNSKYVVEGSVRRIGNHVRITIQLIDAVNDHHIWASNFDRELVDIFATQTDLAREISQSIHLEIQPETVEALQGVLTTNALAYDLYQKSVSIEKTEGETESSTIRRRKLLEQSVQEDPNFVEAWGQLKRMYDLMLKRIRQGSPWTYGATDMEAFQEDLRSSSVRALTKAITLDPNNVESLLASVVNHIEPQPPEILAERKKVYERILKDHPEHAMSLLNYGWWHRHVKDQSGQGVYFNKALEADPFNARLLEEVLWFFENRDQDRHAELVGRLEQIIPETLEARRLARSGNQRLLYFTLEAFKASADEKHLQEFKSAWERTKIEDFNSENHYRSYEAYLHTITRDLDALAKVASQMDFPDYTPDEMWSREIRSFFFVNLEAMCALKLAGRELESAAVARQIITASSLPQVSDNEWLWKHVSPRIATAQAILGENEAAQTLAIDSEALATSSGNGNSTQEYWWPAIAAWVWIDSDHAAELFLKRHAEGENLTEGLGSMATDPYLYAPLITHPKIQALIVQDGKWIDILAERFPEYAALKEAAK